jgi:pyruvate dehydrogenase E2 component (dihydrolipoamide acetyltransferase)
MLKDRLATLTLPVLVVWGKEDRILPVAHADGLPDHVAVTIYDDAGHMPHMEKAAEVNALIGKLIEGGNGQEPPT